MNFAVVFYPRNDSTKEPSVTKCDSRQAAWAVACDLACNDVDAAIVPADELDATLAAMRTSAGGSA
jgi:hypothetical protein